MAWLYRVAHIGCNWGKNLDLVLNVRGSYEDILNKGY